MEADYALDKSKGQIKENNLDNRSPNMASALGNGNVTLGQLTLKEYINRPQPLTFKGPDQITGVDNIGIITASDKIVGQVDRLQPIKSNILQDFNRIELGR